MRTTLDLPDELYRRAKVRAALQGRTLKEMVADGLNMVLKGTSGGSGTPPRRAKFPLIKPKNRRRKLTPAMVTEAEMRLLEEEAAAHGRVSGH